FDREDEARERDFGAIAVVRERGALDVGERAARRQQLLLEVVPTFDRNLGLAQNRETGGICLGRRRVISEAEKCAAHAEGARAGIAEVELQTGERFDIGVLREGREADERAECNQQERPAHESKSSEARRIANHGARPSRPLVGRRLAAPGERAGGTVDSKPRSAAVPAAGGAASRRPPGGTRRRDAGGPAGGTPA